MKTKIFLVILFGLLASPLIGQKREASFFSAKNPQKTFVGAVLDPQSINTDDHLFVNISVPEPITLSFSLRVKPTIILPGYDNMIKAIKESVIGSGKLNSKQTLSYSIKKIKSYQELSWYFGQVMNPSTFWGIAESDKPSKTTIVVDITQEFFSVEMDFPNDGKLYEEDAEIEKRRDELIYVGSLSFGRKVTILLSSETPYANLKAAIEAALTTNKSKPLSEVHRTTLSNAEIRIMALGNPTLSTQNAGDPFASIVEYFHRPVTTEDFGEIIKISASYLKDNSEFVNRY